MFKKYYIKDTATSIGLSIEGLKYYEKMNIVTPNREENGYRYYSHADVARLSTLRYYQSLGLSNEQINETVLNYNNTDNTDIFINTLYNLEFKIKLYQQAIIELKQRKIVIDNLDTLYNKFEIFEREKMCYVDFDENTTKENSIEQAKCLKYFYSLMPFVKPITCLNLPIQNDINLCLSLRIKYSDLLNLGYENTDKIKMVEKSKYLYTIQKIPRHQKFFPFQDNIFEYIKSKNILINPRIEITYLTTINDNDTVFDYYEYNILIIK